MVSLEAQHFGHFASAQATGQALNIFPPDFGSSSNLSVCSFALSARAPEGCGIKLMAGHFVRPCATFVFNWVN